MIIKMIISNIVTVKVSTNSNFSVCTVQPLVYLNVNGILTSSASHTNRLHKADTAADTTISTVSSRAHLNKNITPASIRAGRTGDCTRASSSPDLTLPIIFDKV